MAQTRDAVEDVRTDVTRPLAELASALTYDELPEEARTVARQCLLDMVGVALAGASEPLSRVLLDQIRDEGGHAQASLIGTSHEGSMAQAALFNGTAAHALDYDDVLKVLTGHPTVPVMPAVLAVAERRGLGGSDVIRAFCAGVEVEARVGAMMGDGHYARGWHATATIGTLGAAAGVANLIGLDAERTAAAIGIAATQAAGLKSMFGTMCKPLHAGKAAQNGLNAALLAERGFTSRADVLDCFQGFAHTQADGIDPDAALDRLGEHFHVADVLFKYHAACYGTHAPIEAALKVRKHKAFAPAAVERIELRVHRTCLGMCDIPHPSTGLEAKFSLAHNVALALTGRADGSLAIYDDDQLEHDDVARLRPLVALEAGEPLGPFEAEIVVHQMGGVVIRERHDVEVPERDLERQWEKLEAKFKALAEPVAGGTRTWRMIELARGLDDLGHVGELVTCWSL